MKGIVWAYLRATEPRTPNVDATALQPPSIASSTIFSPSKYAGLAAKDAPAECSIPWSTGRIERYPVPASRPWSKSDSRLRSTRVGRSVIEKIRVTKSGPGRCSCDFGIVLHSCSSKPWASFPRIDSSLLSDVAVAVAICPPFGGSVLQFRPWLAPKLSPDGGAVSGRVARLGSPYQLLRFPFGAYLAFTGVRMLQAPKTKVTQPTMASR